MIAKEITTPEPVAVNGKGGPLYPDYLRELYRFHVPLCANTIRSAL